MSFVLNDVPGVRISEETRQRVQQAARELGYHPDIRARRLVTGQTRILAYVERVTPERAFSDVFLPQVLRGVHAAAQNAGYEVLFAPIPVEEGGDRCAALLRGRHVDGMILSGPRSDDRELRQLLESEASVVLQGTWPGVALASVDIDNASAARAAAEHLIGLGHARIGALVHAPLEHTAAAARLQGYREAIDAAGLEFRPELVQVADFTPASGARAMEALLATGPRPGAVFATSDTIAIGALRAIRSRGLRVPEDIALAAFDDIPMAVYVEPSLTTVRLPAYGIGWAAADLLIRLITDEEVRERHIVLETELVIRDSSGPNGARPRPH